MRGITPPRRCWRRAQLRDRRASDPDSISYRRRRALSASDPAPPASSIAPAARVNASMPAALAPAPVFGGWMPPPAAPPPGLVAVADGGTGVSVGATVGSGVSVAGAVGLNVGVADRTMRMGVHVGTAKSGSA
jgi:hypothetical protein